MTEIPSIRKFMFDKSFEHAMDAARAPERKPVTLKPEQMDALKKDFYDAGFAEGQKTSNDSHSKQIAEVLARIDQRLARLVETMQSMQQEQDIKTRQIALAIARKVMPDFAAKGGLQEIEAMLAAAITEMVHEPRLVVRVHESQFDSVNSKVQDITVQKAYAGKIVVLADAEIVVGDCRVEWADGGMERNAEAAWKDVEKVVAPADGAPAKPEQE
jgi:flagellar assembly protein FliH